MNNYSEFKVGKEYTYGKSSSKFKCIALNSHNHPVLESPSGSIYLASNVSFWIEVETPQEVYGVRRDHTKDYPIFRSRVVAEEYIERNGGELIIFREVIND